MALWGKNNIANSAPKWQTDVLNGNTGIQEYGEDIIYVYGNEGYPVAPGWARRTQGTGNRSNRFMWESLATFKPSKENSFALSTSPRVLIIADSLGAGRGAGTGAVQMDGARVLSWPTKMKDALISMGFNASAESFCEGNNTGGTLPLYDPRVSLGSWTVSAGRTIGGLTLTSVSNTTPFIFTPSSNVDTFEIYAPINGSFGNTSYQIDSGGSPVGFTQNGTAALQKITVSTTLGAHDIRVNWVSGGASYLSPIVAYNSTQTGFRIINMGSRAFSTSDWIQADVAWRQFPAINTYSPHISLISLGINDMRTGGANNTIGTCTTNLQSLIT